MMARGRETVDMAGLLVRGGPRPASQTAYQARTSSDCGPEGRARADFTSSSRHRYRRPEQGGRGVGARLGMTIAVPAVEPTSKDDTDMNTSKTNPSKPTMANTETFERRVRRDEAAAAKALRVATGIKAGIVQSFTGGDIEGAVVSLSPSR